ncbi:ribonuclease R [Methylobrevis albus]|uniref:ribonuclease R n=1 Tax=Methylobrevis albus TaxID=2793297 RepID=UPI001F344A9C
MAKPPRPPQTEPALPTREAVLRFIAEHPGKGTKRDIARAFDVSGDARIGLKKLLKELEGEGLIERKQRRLSTPGALPPVLVCEVVARDSEGDIFAEPVTWDEDDGAPPRLLVIVPRGRRAAATPTPGLGDRFLARVGDLPHGYEATARAAVRVIKLLDRRPSGIIGVFRKTPGGGRIVPVSRKQSEMVVDEEHAGGAEDGDLVSVEVHRAGRYGLPQARVLEKIGSVNSEKAVSMIAIHANEIPYIFPEAVLAEAAAAPAVTLKGGDKREDWRDLPLVTIDPPDAKDHDDAVHAAPDTDASNPGGFVVTVAIADVAAYVRPGSPLDKEALKRGNSVYFPDRVIPMLPERISNDLCSLREGEDRPAVAVRMIFDADGHKKKHQFHRIMMRSAAKLAYGQAQAAIDGRTDEKTEPLLEPVLKPLWDAYACLSKGRASREPLELDLPERKVVLKPDGTVDKVVTAERLDAHKLIEEMMIQANVAAAETLEAKRSPLVYRVHDQPSLQKLESLRDFLQTMDLKFAKQGNLRPGVFNTILARVENTENAHLVNEVVLRSQSQAEYNPINIGHFGLNLRRYAHFTSPIRRYADLIVHRALVGVLGFHADGLPERFEEKLERIAADISAAERRAMMAERETIDRLIAGWLADRIGATFKGRIAGVTKAGLFVKLAESGADGFVPAATLGQDYYAYDETRHALIGSRSGETFQLGDIVDVKLVEVAPLAGALRFEMLSDGRKGRPGGGGRPDKHQRGRRTGPPTGPKGLGPKGSAGPKGRARARG